VLCVWGEWESGRVVPPFPVPSPCSSMGMMLGTGASFGEGFVSVAEARIIAGTRSGRSCGTNCGELHPPAWACQSRTQVSGFLGGLWGGPSPRVCCWFPTDRSGIVEELGMSTSFVTGSGASSGRIGSGVFTGAFCQLYLDFILVYCVFIAALCSMT